MKKYILPSLIALSIVSCKKNSSNDNLNSHIESKNVKGLAKYKELQQKKIDSISALIAKANDQINILGGGEEQRVGSVSVVEIKPSTFVHGIDLQGNVTTDKDVTVQPQFAGTLSLFVKEGQRVSRGQLIGRVADGGLNDQYKQALIQVSAAKSQLQQVKNQANLSKITYEKQSKLWKQNIGSEVQYLQAKTTYQSAQKQIAYANSQVQATQKAADAVKANLDKTAIIAPFGGIVDEVITQNGQIVAPGAPIVKLISLSTMKVEANVPESYLPKVKPGTSVSMFFPALNDTVQSSIGLVGNYINPNARTFKIEIPVSNSSGLIKPNLMAQVKIQDYINPNAKQVPPQYIYEDADGKYYAFVARPTKNGEAVVKKVNIQKGEATNESVEVTTGLEFGDLFITDGSKNLVDGQKVKIKK